MNYICYIYVLCFSYIRFHPNVKASKVYQADWESLNTRPVHKWFEDAKFGIFIHWGVYSVPAYSPSSKDGVDPSARYAEWYVHRLKHKSDVQKYFRNFHNKAYGENINYRSLAKYFKAELFDAKFWAQTFKSSGAKYVVLTSKHHDGYTLWPSKYSENWNAVAVGPGFDILKNLSHAVKSEGLKMGYYYSLLEWRHPWYGKNKWEMMGRYCTEHMIPQMKELINNYNPDILYGDGDWDFLSKVYQTPSFFEWLFNESPVKDSIVINDRWGKETRGKHGGYYTTEYDTLKKLTDNVENSSFSKVWEECRGIGASFGYNKNENLEDYSSSEQLIHILINKVSRGGNLLLNIGPTADGRIPVIMQQRLCNFLFTFKISLLLLCIDFNFSFSDILSYV